MRDELIKLLNEVRNHCINSNINLELLWPELIMKNYLSQDEKDIVYSSQNMTSTAKKLKMFELLQSKDEMIFWTLFNLFQSFGWKEALDVLVTGLRGAGYGYLIREHTESSPSFQTGLKDVSNKAETATVPVDPLSAKNLPIVNEKAIEENERFYAEILPLCKDVPDTCGYIGDFNIDGIDGTWPAGVDMNEVYYNLSNPRGLALIINNKDFNRSPMRLGTDIDEANMENVLKKLKYEVEIKKNLTAAKIMTTMEDFAKREEHKLCHSTVVVILTHGNRFGDLVGIDEEKVPVDNFIGTLNGNRCSALINKPKIFFIQACRGKNHDRGVGVSHTTDSEVDEVDTDLQKIPLEADMFIAFSTTPGYVSWRNTTTGTWFIQAICQSILKYSRQKHILEIFTNVQKVVAENLSSSKKICAADCKGNCTGKCKRVQMAESTSRLRKLFYFFPGL